MQATYTPSFLIDYDENRNLLTVEVEGFITREDNKTLLEEIAHQIMATNVDRLLLDAQRSRTTPAETIKWVSEHYLNLLGEWLPYLNRKIKIARVEPSEICQQLQYTIIEKVRQASASSIEIRFFRDVTSARQWLAK